MKRLLTYLIFVVVFCLFPIKVFASGNITAAPSTLTIEVGSSKKFTITAKNAIGDVSIASSDSKIAKVSASEWGTGMVEEGKIKSGTITVTGVSEGTATITLTLDAATFDGEDLAGQKRTVKVTVVKKGSLPETPTITKSTNNKLKSLTIVGYTPNKVDDNNYTLTVDNTVNSITINAVAEDEKATIKGTGSHNLNPGDNNISITITSESGAQNTINVKVTRKEQATIDDLDKLLSGSNNTIDISINNVSSVNEDVLNRIKSSGKTVNLKYFDDKNNNVYTWVIDGKKLDSVVTFNPLITFTSNNIQELMKDANYASGKVINFAHNGKLPANTIVKIFVGDEIQNNSLVNVYEYKDNAFVLVKDKLTVQNGYVEFSLEHCSLYFVTLANITNGVCENNTQVSNDSMLLIIVSAILTILVIFNIWYFLIRRKKSISYSY